VPSSVVFLAVAFFLSPKSRVCCGNLPFKICRTPQPLPIDPVSVLGRVVVCVGEVVLLGMAAMFFYFWGLHGMVLCCRNAFVIFLLFRHLPAPNFD